MMGVFYLQLGDLLDVYIGTYVPNTYDSTTTTETITVFPDGTTTTNIVTVTESVIPDGISGVDIKYVSSVLILLCSIYFLFRCTASIIRSIFNFNVRK